MHDADDQGPQKRYELTAAGREELAAWWSLVPVDDPPPRDELMLKVLFAIGTNTEHALAVITAHRTALVVAAATAPARTARGRARTRSRDRDGARRARRARRSGSALARPLRSPAHRAEGKPAMSAILEFDDVVKSFGSGLTEVRALRGRHARRRGRRVRRGDGAERLRQEHAVAPRGRARGAERGLGAGRRARAGRARTRPSAASCAATTSATCSSASTSSRR